MSIESLGVNYGVDVQTYDVSRNNNNNNNDTIVYYSIFSTPIQSLHQIGDEYLDIFTSGVARPFGSQIILSTELVGSLIFMLIRNFNIKHYEYC